MKTYSLNAINNYLDQIAGADCDIYTIPGCLLDSYVINWGGVIEILQETYLNDWSSAYTRHIYRKRIPKSIYRWLENETVDNSGYCEDYSGELIEIFNQFNEHHKMQRILESVKADFEKAFPVR